MKTNNTITARHIKSINKNRSIKLCRDKNYYWNIPKRLKQTPIQKGDMVLVPTKRGKRRVIVMDVFREKYEETGRLYKKVIRGLNRAPKLVQDDQNPMLK